MSHPRVFRLLLCAGALSWLGCSSHSPSSPSAMTGASGSGGGGNNAAGGVPGGAGAAGSDANGGGALNGGAAGSSSAGSAGSGFPLPEPSAMLLRYDQPATNWESEALPIGNGRIGAMVFGGIASERLQLNVDSLWSGDANPDGSYDTR